MVNFAGGEGLYANEPKRDSSLKVLKEQPYNAETPLNVLTDSFYSPNEIFFVRNHFPVPKFNNEDGYKLHISGLGILKNRTLTLDDIKNFPKYEIVSAIMCTGNRRAEMKALREYPANSMGVPWGAGAIGNAKWGAARLYDILKSAGLSRNETKAKHVQFEGYDKGKARNKFHSAYGASIPITKAFSPDGNVLLAYEMNGKVLPPDHGYPLRVVVPGVVGARSVKWLKSVIVSDVESESIWQQEDYKIFNPSTNFDENLNVDWSKSPAIQNAPVTSAICKPSPNGTEQLLKHNSGPIQLKGYAYSGSGNKIVRVDLTSDQGETWFDGKIDKQDSVEEPHHYGWTIWSATVNASIHTQEMEIWSKAVDSSHNLQPESVKNIWNLRGLLSNAYFKLNIHNK